MAELGNEPNGTLPKSSHLSPVQRRDRAHCTKLHVMFSGSDLVTGAVGDECLKKPHSCICSLQYMTRASLGGFKSESGQLTSAEDNSLLRSLSYLAHMYYTSVPFTAG